MSERSSFVTEYIYCPKCLKALEKELIGNDKYLCSLLLPSWEGKEKTLPIIAGKVGGLGPGDDYILLTQLLDNAHICHPVTIAFLGDDGTREFIVVKPEEEE